MPLTFEFRDYRLVHFVHFGKGYAFEKVAISAKFFAERNVYVDAGQSPECFFSCLKYTKLYSENVRSAVILCLYDKKNIYNDLYDRDLGRM